MIIFDLEAIADDSHRRHLITPPEAVRFIFKDSVPHKNGCILVGNYESESGEIWEPDYEAYNEACGGDEPIKAVLDLYRKLFTTNEYVVIWSAHCESARENLVLWMKENGISRRDLKMRPVGDTRPKEKIFENWYDLHNVENPRNNVDFVFSSHKPTINMFRRRGIFVFDCNQED